MPAKERYYCIRKLENEKLLLQERIEELSGSGHAEKTEGTKTHKYSSDM